MRLDEAQLREALKSAGSAANTASISLAEVYRWFRVWLPPVFKLTAQLFNILEGRRVTVRRRGKKFNFRVRR